MKKDRIILLDDEEVTLLDDEENDFVTEEIKTRPFSSRKNLFSHETSGKKQDSTANKTRDIEVISVVWPEEKHGKQYLYNPNGETVEEGDTVLVPSYDKERDIEIEREATVSEGNHRIDPSSLRRTPKKIISVVARKQDSFPPEQPSEQPPEQPEPAASAAPVPTEEINDTENTEKGFLYHLKKFFCLS